MHQALVLAAGLGSRIRPVAGNLPKPLIPFGGAPILAHNLRWLAAGGVTEVWMNLHFAADAIRAEIGDGSAFGLKVTYVYEPELLGTAGALGNIRNVVEGPMLVVYGDSVVRCDLEALAAQHERRGAEATVALFNQDRHPHTGIAGGRVQIAPDGAIQRFIEGAGDMAGQPLVNAGVYAVSPSILELIPAGFSDFGRDIFPAMLAQDRRLDAWLIDEAGFCLGLDTPESYAAGVALLDRGLVRL
jgi:mannose-1-phosphate guanylyltransferase